MHLLHYRPMMFGVSGLDRVEALPIEGDAVAGTIRRERETILDLERFGDIALEPEAMGFEIGAVGAGCEKMDSHVVSAVAGDGKIEGLRQMGDLHERRDAAAIGDVGLGIS